MLSEKQLKDQLQAIAADDYRVPTDLDYWQLSQDMLAQLGSIDPVLRDELIYTTFGKWARAELFSADQYHALLNSALDDEHLFLGLGERDTDLVFMRAFALLVIAIVLYHHRQQPFLTPLEVGDTLTKILRALNEERDLRGYVEGKGWAHATAHAADVLDELAQCDEIGREGLLQILAAVRAKASTPEAAFCHEEDERLAYAVLSLFGRGLLTEQDMELWLRAFAPIERSGEWRSQHLNVKHFLRSLYFQAKYRHIAEWICAPIDETLYAISHFK